MLDSRVTHDLSPIASPAAGLAHRGDAKDGRARSSCTPRTPLLVPWSPLTRQLEAGTRQHRSGIRIELLSQEPELLDLGCFDLMGSTT